MPKSKGNPPCPACGSSATLPFENEENARAEESFIEIVLAVFLLLLIFFCVLLVLLLGHDGLPALVLIVLSCLMLWRQRKKSRRPQSRLRQFVCLDCSRNFKA